MFSSVHSVLHFSCPLCVFKIPPTPFRLFRWLKPVLSSHSTEIDCTTGMALLRSCFRPLVHVGQRQVSWVFGKGLSQLCPPESCFVPEWRIFSCTQTMGCPPKQWPFTLGRIHPRDLNNSLIRKIYIIISLVYHSWVSMTSSNCYSRQGVHRSVLATDPFECELT